MEVLIANNNIIIKGKVNENINELWYAIRQIQSKTINIIFDYHIYDIPVIYILLLDKIKTSIDLKFNIYCKKKNVDDGDNDDIKVKLSMDSFNSFGFQPKLIREINQIDKID